MLVREGSVVKTELDEMFSTHEEADSRMLFHLSSVQSPANVVIRTIDTDVLIIALGCFWLVPEGLIDGNRCLHKEHIEIHQHQPNLQKIKRKTLQGFTSLSCFLWV